MYLPSVNLRALRSSNSDPVNQRLCYRYSHHILLCVFFFATHQMHICVYRQLLCAAEVTKVWRCLSLNRGVNLLAPLTQPGNWHWYKHPPCLQADGFNPLTLTCTCVNTWQLKWHIQYHAFRITCHFFYPSSDATDEYQWFIEFHLQINNDYIGMSLFLITLRSFRIPESDRTHMASKQKAHFRWL